MTGAEEEPREHGESRWGQSVSRDVTDRPRGVSSASSNWTGTEKQDEADRCPVQLDGENWSAGRLVRIPLQLDGANRTVGSAASSPLQLDGENRTLGPAPRARSPAGVRPGVRVIDPVGRALRRAPAHRVRAADL